MQRHIFKFVAAEDATCKYFLFDFGCFYAKKPTFFFSYFSRSKSSLISAGSPAVIYTLREKRRENGLQLFSQLLGL